MADTASLPSLDFCEAQLRNWKLLAEFQRRLAPVLTQAPKTRTEQDPRRQLLSADYYSLLLFALLNPVIKTARGLCAASQFGRMQREV